MDTSEISKEYAPTIDEKPKWLTVIVIVYVVLLFFYKFLFSAPTPTRRIVVHIAKNQTLSSIANDLEQKNIIRYASVLKFFTSLMISDKQIKRGDYLFEKNLPVWRVAWMLAHGEHNISPIKIVLREGSTNEEMATVLSSNLNVFDKDIFLNDSKDKQGYLFPDTYLFYPETKTEEVLSELSDNFLTRLKNVSDDIEKSGKSLEDIVIMASIIQKEARDENDAGLISGVLWHRIRIGMPLQVDVDKWTYKNKGLPSAPIGNPGLVAILAAVNPVDSPYLYYLHDKKGDVHFAKTYSEHSKNIAKYLK